jgi:hypothetical protein
MKQTDGHDFLGEIQAAQKLATAVLAANEASVLDGKKPQIPEALLALSKKPDWSLDAHTTIEGEFGGNHYSLSIRMSFRLVIEPLLKAAAALDGVNQGNIEDMIGLMKPEMDSELKTIVSNAIQPMSVGTLTTYHLDELLIDGETKESLHPVIPSDVPILLSLHEGRVVIDFAYLLTPQYEKLTSFYHIEPEQFKKEAGVQLVLFDSKDQFDYTASWKDLGEEKDLTIVITAHFEKR